MDKFILLPVNIVSGVHAFRVSVCMVQFVHRVDIWGIGGCFFHLGGNISPAPHDRRTEIDKMIVHMVKRDLNN